MKLLCIDDDSDDFMFFEEAVKGQHSPCECIHATNGLMALMLLETLLPDLIFLDNNMPYMNGLETLRCIRENKTFKSIPVYMLSTYIPHSDCEKFLKLGADGCLTKPGSFDQLRAKLQEVIQKHIA